MKSSNPNISFSLKIGVMLVLVLLSTLNPEALQTLLFKNSTLLSLNLPISSITEFGFTFKKIFLK